jgi:6,7-dimethyl-8-ribityllumazine synthase
VIRGETFHFQIVAGESARALMDLGVARRLPVGNGILTVENEAQAFARAKRSEGDKGGKAASAVLALVRLARAGSK